MIQKAFFLPNESCPHRCVYCDQHIITGKQEGPSLDLVKKTIKELNVHDRVEICYFGGSFTCLPMEVQKSYLDPLLEGRPSNKVRFSTHPTCFNEQVFGLLQKYPISMIELGISSFDDLVLRKCSRGYSGAEAQESIKTLLDRGYSVGAQMMTGLPGQNEASSFSDLETLYSISNGRELTLRIYPCLVLKDTGLEKLLKNGQYYPLPLHDAVTWAGKLHSKALKLGFKVQRIGLHETPSLDSSVIAGPHHPALGELARSYSLVLHLLEEAPIGPWRIPRRSISLLRGHASFGIRSLSELSGLSIHETEKRVSYI